MFFKELQVNKEINLIIDLFKKDNNGEFIDWHIDGHKLIINSENNELMLHFNDCINDLDCTNEFGLIEKTIELTVVQFLHKRQGHCTNLIEILYEYGRNHGYNYIVLECVLTNEMSNFASKNGFIKLDKVNWKKEITVK